MIIISRRSRTLLLVLERHYRHVKSGIHFLLYNLLKSIISLIFFLILSRVLNTLQSVIHDVQSLFASYPSQRSLQKFSRFSLRHSHDLIFWMKTSGVNAIRWCPKFDKLYTAGRDSIIRKWSLQGRFLMHKFRFLKSLPKPGKKTSRFLTRWNITLIGSMI